MRLVYLLKGKLIVFQKIEKIFSEFSCFTFAAVCSFLTDIIIFSILSVIGINYLIAQSVARLFGGTVSFYINRNVSFKSLDTKIKTQIKRFILLYILSYTLSLILIKCMYNDLEIGLVYAKLISDFICFIFNYCIMKMYVYFHYH